MVQWTTVRRAMRGIKREWQLHLLAVFSLTVSFICLTAAMLVVTNVHAVSERWGQTARLTVYLKDTATPSEVGNLKDALLRVDGLADVKYISGSQAHAEFSSREVRLAGDQKVELAELPAEAFPSSIEIQVKSEMTKPEVQEIVQKLHKIAAVEDVETYEQWTGRLAAFVRNGVFASIAFSLLVLLSVLAIVGSTIRLVLQKRRGEVEVLKLVGATNQFVKGPFLIEGGAQGAFGALFALLLVFFGFLATRAQIHGSVAPFLGIEIRFLSFPLVLGLLAFGGLIGVAAASLGLKKLVAV